jgi:hypothetical protein
MLASELGAYKYCEVGKEGGREGGMGGGVGGFKFFFLLFGSRDIWVSF